MKLFSDEMRIYYIKSNNGNVDVYRCGQVDLETGEYSSEVCKSDF